MKPRNLPVAAQNLSLLSGLGAVLFAWAAVALWHSLPGPWSLAALPLAHTAAAAVVISVAATERLSQRTIGLFGKVWPPGSGWRTLPAPSAPSPCPPATPPNRRTPQPPRLRSGRTAACSGVVPCSSCPSTPRCSSCGEATAP